MRCFSILGINQLRISHLFRKKETFPNTSQDLQGTYDAEEESLQMCPFFE